MGRFGGRSAPSASADATERAEGAATVLEAASALRREADNYLGPWDGAGAGARPRSESKEAAARSAAASTALRTSSTEWRRPSPRADRGQPADECADATPLRGELWEALHEHRRALRDMAVRHEAALRAGMEAVVERFGRELADLPRQQGGPAEAAGWQRAEAGAPAGAPPPGEASGDPSRSRRTDASYEPQSVASRSGGVIDRLADAVGFSQFDANADGVITRSEFLDASARGATGNHSLWDLDRAQPQRRESNFSDDSELNHAANAMHSFPQILHIRTLSRPRIQSARKIDGEYISSRLADVFSTKEPTRKGRIAGLLQSFPFILFTNVVICANCAFIVDTANRRVRGTSDEFTVMVVEGIFTAWYLVELILKLMVHQFFYFTNSEGGFNVLDLFLVIMGIFELVIYWVREMGTWTIDTGFLRTLRIFKVAKALRMFRALRVFAEIRLMMECVAQSLGSLVWAVFLLAFLALLFSIFFVQAVATAIEADSLSEEESADLLGAFGSVRLSVFSLTQATTGGEDWMMIYRLLAPLGWFPRAVFVFFIVFMAIAVMNIVTSVFLDKAMHVAKPGVEAMMLDKHHQDMADAKELTEMVSKMDTMNSGKITFSNFMSYMKEEKFRLYFDVRGLNVKDTAMFFKMLSSASKSGSKDDESEDEDTVDLRAFVTGCMRLKGVASCMDLYTLSWEIKQMRNDQERLMQSLVLLPQMGHLKEHLKDASSRDSSPRLA